MQCLADKRAALHAGPQTNSLCTCNLQEDSIKQKNNVHVAGVYCLQCPTHKVGPRLTALETAESPEDQLFKRLESMAEREPLNLRPGTLLLAVYGDNWCVYMEQVEHVSRRALLELDGRAFCQSGHIFSAAHPHLITSGQHLQVCHRRACCHLGSYMVFASE